MKLLGRILMAVSVLGAGFFFIAIYAQRTKTTHINPALIWLGKTILAVTGWRFDGELPDVPKMVMIAAPHTSYWDGPVMLTMATALDIKLDWLVKGSAVRGPLGALIKFFGGIPVDRSGKGNMVKQAIDTINTRDEIVLVIAPEGKRTKMPFWKTGFYRIALETNIPLVFGYVDYKHKVAGVGPMYMPSGDIDADMAVIRKFYAPITPKFPDEYGEIKLRKQLRNA